MLRMKNSVTWFMIFNARLESFQHISNVFIEFIFSFVPLNPKYAISSLFFIIRTVFQLYLWDEWEQSKKSWRCHLNSKVPQWTKINGNRIACERSMSRAKLLCFVLWQNSTYLLESCLYADLINRFFGTNTLTQPESVSC